VRVYYLHGTLEATYDITWEGYIFLWTAVEVELGVTTSSLPPLLQLCCYCLIAPLRPAPAAAVRAPTLSTTDRHGE